MLWSMMLPLMWTAVICLCTCTYAEKVVPGILYGVHGTCHHAYGTVLETLTSVPSLIQCAAHCTQVSTCRSAMYTDTSECTLNDATADTATLPSDCGVKYLTIHVDGNESEMTTTQTPTGDFGACSTTPDCGVSGSVCTGGNCQCDTGLTFNADPGVCSSTTDFSVCDPANGCSSATSTGQPWTIGADHLKVGMQCPPQIPDGSTLQVSVRMAFVSNVPIVIESGDFEVLVQITELEAILTNKYDFWAPIAGYFNMIYLGHVLSWDGATPVCDVDIPAVQCRVISM